MSDVMTALKTEIVRLARKEAKAAADPIRKPSIAARKTLADLKRRVAVLEKEIKRLTAPQANVPQPEPEAASAGTGKWISGKGVRGLRQKLGLSQGAFARLVGVTPKAVCLWEGKSGMLRMRDATKAAVMGIRGLGAREAGRRLEEMSGNAKANPKSGKRGNASRSGR